MIWINVLAVRLVGFSVLKALSMWSEENHETKHKEYRSVRDAVLCANECPVKAIEMVRGWR